MRAASRPVTVYACPECPATFRRFDSEIESLTPTCSNTCRSVRRRRLNRLNASRVDGLRTCSSCDRDLKPLNFEPYADERRRNVLKSRCRACVAQYQQPARRRQAPEPPPCYTGPSDLVSFWDDNEDRPIGAGVMGSAP